MLYRSGCEFIVETEPAGSAAADGELLGRTPITVSVMPRAARQLVPRDR